MEEVYAAVTALVITILPTLLFLCLWYGLDYLRDDELLERVQQRQDVPEYNPRFLDIDHAAVSPAAAPSAGQLCPECGEHNRSDVDYCRECLSELP